MYELMGQYRDVPMDLADASLVVTAETLNLRQIFYFGFRFLCVPAGRKPSVYCDPVNTPKFFP
jgi:predicted nucleic acid-binding protein